MVTTMTMGYWPQYCHDYVHCVLQKLFIRPPCWLCGYEV